MSALLAPLVTPATYTRWLHMFIAAGFAAACGAVVPGLEGPPATTAVGLLLVPVPVLVVLGLIPSVRAAERSQARGLLLAGDGTELSGGSDRSWPARWRTVAWLVLRLEVGVPVAFLTVQLLQAAVTLSMAPLSTGEVVVLGRTLPAAHSPLWLPLVPVLLVSLIYLVAIAGRLLAAGARQLLGPSPVERLAALEQRTEQLLEHNRLSREIHDSIGHALTITVLQAAAARELGGRNEQFLQQALTAIEESGRRAMVDLERVLVLLRDGRPPAQEQQPTLADADRLLAAARATGAPVVAHIEGPIDSLPAVVSREGYRILQEGLTNVFRHVGPVPITVRVLAGADRLNLSVSNPLPVGDGGGQQGRADPALDPPGTGSSLMRDPSGLRGVRERATLLRGDVTAGRVGADWLLHVRLPLGLPG